MPVPPVPPDELPNLHQRVAKVRELLMLAGHGIAGDKVILLARHYLDVPLLPGSVITDEAVRIAEFQLRHARERYARMYDEPEGSP